MKTLRSNRRPMSLATRVLLFVASAVALCLIMLETVVERSINRHFAEQDAGELQVVATAVRQVLVSNDDDHPRLPAALSRAVSGHHGVYFQVRDQSGEVLYASPGPNLDVIVNNSPPAERISVTNMYTWREGGNFYRGAAVKAGADTPDFIIATAIDMGFHVQFMNGFRQTLWTIMAGAGTLTLLAAWLGVRQGHLPLRELGKNMRAIQSDRLQTRLDPHALPIELRELVHSFNQMIGQLEEGFARLAHFSTDIAHELRTPLTNLITQTQVALGSARTADEYRDLLFSNLEEQERMAKMVGDMLWLAQTDRGLIKPVFTSLDLALEVRALFDFFEAWAEENQVYLALEAPAARVQGDRSMLRRALSNLLSNAIRHTPAGGTVSVNITQPTDDAVDIVVRNPGTDIPRESLSHIFDRFYRADPSRQRQNEGAGLGLAIVRSIIEIHDGTIATESSGGITTFLIHLPVFSDR